MFKQKFVRTLCTFKAYLYCITIIHVMQFKVFFELIYHNYIITFIYVLQLGVLKAFHKQRIWGGYCNTWLDVILMDMHFWYMKSWALTLLCDLLDSDVSEDPSHGWWNCFQRSCTHSHYLDIRSQQIFAWKHYNSVNLSYSSWDKIIELYKFWIKCPNIDLW